MRPIPNDPWEMVTGGESIAMCPVMLVIQTLCKKVRLVLYFREV